MFLIRIAWYRSGKCRCIRMIVSHRTQVVTYWLAKIRAPPGAGRSMTRVDGWGESWYSCDGTAVLGSTGAVGRCSWVTHPVAPSATARSAPESFAASRTSREAQIPAGMNEATFCPVTPGTPVIVTPPVAPRWLATHLRRRAERSIPGPGGPATATSCCWNVMARW